MPARGRRRAAAGRGPPRDSFCRMGAIDDYARLVVRVGVAVRPGQDVLVDAQIAHAPFVRAVVEEAYRAGAHRVDVEYRDPWVRRAMIAEAPEDAFGYSPPGLLARMEHAKETGAAVIAVSGGSNSDVYEGLDTARLAHARMPALEESWLPAGHDRKGGGGIVAPPRPRRGGAA